MPFLLLSYNKEVQILIFILLFISLFFVSRILTRSISAFIYGVSRSQNFSIRLFHTLFLPGVVIHELAHLITAELMFVRTSGLNFSMRREGDGLVMGSVGIERTDLIRRAIIGFAPVFVGVLLITFSVIFLFSDKSPFSDILNYLFIFIIVFEVGNTMYSSRKDLEGTVELFAVLMLIIAVLYFFGFRFPDSFINFLNSASVQNIFLRANYVLAIPLIIDLIISGILRTINTR